MKNILGNRLFQIGFWLFVVGCGPLLGIVFLASIGLWPDPDPNPIGPGLLFFFTFWPAVICMGIGARAGAAAARVAPPAWRGPTGAALANASGAPTLDSAEFARRMQHIIVPANEQNLDRLAAEVLRMGY